MPTPSNATTHGMSSTPEYRLWANIIQRCTNPEKPTYKYYGGRGISIHPEWIDDFQAFFTHIGPRPTPEHSMDRRENSLGYVPGNLRWATRSEQNRNTRINIWVEYEGELRLLIEVCEELGLPYRTVRRRKMDYGWSDADLFEPIRPHKKYSR